MKKEKNHDYYVLGGVILLILLVIGISLHLSKNYMIKSDSERFIQEGKVCEGYTPASGPIYACCVNCHRQDMIYKTHKDTCVERWQYGCLLEDYDCLCQDNKGDVKQIY